jgi:hypothetical protein
MKKNFLIQAFNLIIVISIIFKSFQLIDRIYNIIILNLQLNNNGDYRNQIQFIFQELKIERVFRYIIFGLYIIMFSIWMYVKYKNAHRLAKVPLTYKSIWALFSFIIPIFNLVAPYKIVNDLWTVFNRDMSVENEGRNLIKQWWFLSIGLFIFGKYISIKFNSVANLNDFLNAEYYYLALYAISFHYYFLVRKIVNNINK